MDNEPWFEIIEEDYSPTNDDKCSDNLKQFDYIMEFDNNINVEIKLNKN